MKCIKPEVSLDELKILRAYVAAEANVEQCDQDISPWYSVLFSKLIVVSSPRWSDHQKDKLRVACSS